MNTERRMSVNELSNDGPAEGPAAALNAAKAVISRRGGLLLSTRQIARRLGTHRTTVMRWILKGRLPAVKIGGRYRVKEEDLAWVIRPVEPKQKRETPVPTLAEQRREDERRTREIAKEAGFSWA